MQVSDPAGDVRLPDGEAPTGVTYNWTLKKWLPVPRQLVAPDGSHYTYEDSAHSLHLVDGASGTDTVLAAGGGGIPIGVDANYVYVVTPNGSVPAGRNGLTEVPTSGAAAIPITSSGSWYMVSGGEVWGLDQQGKTFPGFTDQIAGHVLDRLDLATKAATAWLTSTDAYYVITDVTSSGEPILLGGTNQYYADTEYLVTGQGQAPVIGGEIDIWDGEIDKYGTWLVGTESAAIWYGAGSSSPTLWAKY